MNLAKQAITSVLWSNTGRYFSFAISFSGQLVLARILVPENFGVVAFAAAILEVTAILTGWSFSMGIIQMPEEEGIRETAFWLTLGQAAIFLVSAAVISIGLNVYYPDPGMLPWVFLALSFGRAVSPIAAIYSAHMEKVLQYGGLTLVTTVAGIVSMCLAIVLGTYGAGVWSLVARELISSVICLVGYRAISGWRVRWRFDVPIGRRLMAFGNRMLLSRGLEAIFYKMDSLLVGALGGVGTLSYYSQPRYLVDLAHASISPATGAIALPVYASVQSDEYKLKRAYRIGNYFIIRLMVPVSLILFLFPEDLVVFLFGDQWKPSGAALRWLALYPVLVTFFENSKILLYGIGRQGTTAWIRVLQIVIAAPLIWLGFDLFGLPGSSLGFMAGVSSGLVAVLLCTRRYSFEGLQETLLVPLVAGFVSVLGVSLVRTTLFQATGPTHVLGLSILAVLLYAGILLLCEHKLILQHMKLISGAFKHVAPEAGQGR